MGYQEYLDAQSLLSSVGEPLLAFVGVAAAATLLATLISLRRPDLRGVARRLQLVTLLGLLLGFGLIVKFHLAIHSLEIGFSAADSFRFSVAPWTESEKPLFWSILLGVASYALWRREDDVAVIASSSFAVLVLLMVFLDPVFPRPLPTLQSSIEAWYGAGGQRTMVYRQLRGLSEFYGSNYMWLHPPTLFVSYTALVVTLAGSLVMLRGRDGWTPTYHYSAFGYLSLTAGLLLGYPWAVNAWGDQAWWWDPKIGGSLMMWVLYSGYLHLGLYQREHRLWTGVLGVICFLGLVFTYLLTYIVSGVHTVG